MRILCPHCGFKTVITNSKKIDARFRDIYINCISPHCSSRSVMRVSHVATITPPLADLGNALHEWFANLPETQQKTIAKTYQPALF